MSNKINKEQEIIEYHDISYTKTITYGEFEDKKCEIKSLLSNLTKTENHKVLSLYIAINYDIKQYIIPLLISGIIGTEKFAFAFNSDASMKICSRLTINLIFSHQILPNHDIIFYLHFHGETIYLLRNKSVKVRNEYSYGFNSSVRFYYAITTSGTTGAPKMIRVTDKSIMTNVSDFSRILRITSQDKIAQLTPLTFDPSMVEIFLSLQNYCTLFMASDELKRYPQLLLNKMVNSKVTIYQTTPSLLLGKWSRQSLKSSLLSKNTALKALLLGGEPFLKLDILDNIKEEDCNTRIFNIYGITEVSCWSSISEICPDRTEVEINFLGEPMSDSIFQVRKDNCIVEDGQGILYIGSRTRICQIDDEPIKLDNSPVYRNTGDLVEIKSNKIYYIGRSDATIKRFGNKINLNTLECHVEKNSTISKSAVIWDESKHKLHLFVVPSTIFYDEKTLKRQLRDYLRNLASCYDPDEIYCLRHFPVTEHGKICKLSLKEIAVEREKPLDHLTVTVRRLWNDYLFVCNDDGFLDLGGNSITALQLSNEISSLFDIDVSGVINILLNNCNFKKFLEFITKICNMECFEEKDIIAEENSTSRKNDISDTIADFNMDNVSDLKLLWQKSRGDDSNGHISEIKSIVFDRKFDLEKCVDASPTIFQYSNGATFVSVGSHSGIIYTVPLNNLHSSDCYQIRLPDRIEASVLALDGFRGIVGCYDGNVYCLKLNTGDIVWKFQTGNMVKCTALEASSFGCIFVGSYDTYMYCLNVKDGKQIWRTKVSSGSITAKPRFSVDNQMLIVATLDGTGAALDINSGNIQWSRKFSHPMFSSPAILKNGHVIFCTVVGDLICFDIYNDFELWSYATKLNIFSYPVIHTDPCNNRENICVVAHDTFFRLEYNENDVNNPPKLRYKVKLQNATFCTPWCEGNFVILTDSGGMVYVVNFQDGISLMEIKLSGEIFSSPVLCDDNVAIGCRDNHLYLLKILHDS